MSLSLHIFSIRIFIVNVDIFIEQTFQNVEEKMNLGNIIAAKSQIELWTSSDVSVIFIHQMIL